MKNCIEKEKLFDFYNQTFDKDQMIKISEHIEKCESCQHAFLLLSQNISTVKDSIQLINPEIKEIPEFKISSVKFIQKNKTNYKSLLRLVAGICLLVTISTLSVLKITHFQKPDTDYEFLDYIPDMNDAWKKQIITVTTYDKSGNPTNHQVIEN